MSTKNLTALRELDKVRQHALNFSQDGNDLSAEEYRLSRALIERLTPGQLPSVLWCASNWDEQEDDRRYNGDWKVSPHGDDDPDRDCEWFDTRADVIIALADIAVFRIAEKEVN